ncbi:kinase-like protein [Pluteus cervinus]|uniref:Kinase-like protein n=1 Tax=Pluteus cervinus TaxID=181527 RepID=A0ACD3AWA1_9AGAR|nr:kinase-like protein [Pluteus cervinus]
MALESGDFHFTSMGTTEDMTRYTVGGYHPIRIGDIIGSTREDDTRSSGDTKIAQYRIMHKLGFGSFAMVWLAQMTTSPAFVEVKITTADDASTNEAAMLKAVLKVRTIGERHVPTLLDHFILRGPNGEHLVLVTDVVAPILEVPFSGPLWRKTVALGLVKAVAHLHANGIVHGDLHLGNVGVAIPKLIDEDPNEIMQDLGAYNARLYPSKQTSSLPPYVVSPCELPTFYKQLANSNLPQTKLFDFGGAHEVGKLPLDFQCAVVACAPETVFSLVVEKIDNPPMELPTDIWALGTAIYEIVTGSSLFYGVDYSGIFSKMAEMLGTLPDGWKEWWKSRSKAPAVSPSGADAWWIQRREILRKNCADDADVDALIALLRKILVLDPKARPTPEQILQDA